MLQHTLSKYDLDQLADEMITLLDTGRDKWLGWIRLHQLLLQGKPLSPDRIEAYLHISSHQVADLIEGAELDKDGNVVGLGLSIVPTPHSYQIDGRHLYVWCAFDAIMFPVLHQSGIVIQSLDPISEEKIRLTSAPGGIQGVVPGTAVVSWVPGINSPEDIRANFCDFTHFFASEATASKYVAKHPGLVILSVEQAFQIGKLMWNREPYQSIIKELSITEG